MRIDVDRRQWLRKATAQVRLFYILGYMLVVASVAMIPVRLIVDGKIGFIYNALAGVGFLLFLCEVLLNPEKYFKSWSGILRIVFLCIIVVSTVVNMKYGVTNNLKTLCWTGIQIIVLTAVDTEELSTQHILKQFRQFSETFSLIWTIGVAVSLWQFAAQYSSEYWLLGSVSISREGFTEGRLFGVFTDPNYASLCSCAAIFFAISNIMLGKKKFWGIFYHALVIFMQLSYVVLAASRTAKVGIVVVVFAVTLLLMIKDGIVRKKIWRKTLIPVVCACLSVAVCLGSWKLIQKGYSYVPELYDAATGKQSEEVTVDFVREDVVNSDDLSNNRFKIWKDYIEVFKKTPIVGTSPRNALEYTADHFENMYILDTKYSVHNTYLALFVCTGVLGGSVMLLWLVLTAIRVLRYLVVNSPNEPNYNIILMLTCIMAIYALAAFPLLFMFFNNMIIDILFWTTLGFLMALIKKEEVLIK